MTPGDLTTLANIKDWIGIAANNTGSDTLLSGLITRISGSIRTEIERYNLTAQTYVEIRDGMGTNQMVLKNWPVISIYQVKVGAVVVPQGTATDGTRGAGWYLSPYDGNPPGNAQLLELRGYNFDQGVQNVSVTYAAGYQIANEIFTAPASPYIYTTLQPKGTWGADDGVAYVNTSSVELESGPGVWEWSDGTGMLWSAYADVLTRVSSNPGSGQYCIPSPGVYQFSAGNAGATLVMSYSFVPFDLEQAAIEWIADRNSYRGRIGVRSKNLAGMESVSYDTSGVPDFVHKALMPYKSVLQIL